MKTHDGLDPRRWHQQLRAERDDLPLLMTDEEFKAGYRERIGRAADAFLADQPRRDESNRCRGPRQP